MRKEIYLQKVLDEINHLKQNATPEEKEFLDVNDFDHTHSHYCIYGQLTGKCSSVRSLELSEKAFVYIHKNSDLDGNDVSKFEDLDFKQVGEEEKNDDHCYTYLEHFLYACDRSGHVRIIKYIKGTSKRELSFDDLERFLIQTDEKFEFEIKNYQFKTTNYS